METKSNAFLNVGIDDKGNNYTDREFTFAECCGIFAVVREIDKSIINLDGNWFSERGEWQVFKGNLKNSEANVVYAYNKVTDISVSCVQRNDFYSKGVNCYAVDGIGVKHPYALRMDKDRTFDIELRTLVNANDKFNVTAEDVIQSVVNATYLADSESGDDVLGNMVKNWQSGIEEARDNFNPNNGYGDDQGANPVMD